MNREEYQKAKEIFQSALDTAPDERTAFLEKACAGNEDLRREVERLLDAVDSQFLEMPAVAGLADMVINENTGEDATKILPDDARQTQLMSVEMEQPPDENALRPSRLRSVLIYLAFIFAVVYILANFLIIQQQPPRIWRFSTIRNDAGYHTISSASTKENLLLGDEILSFNGGIPFSFDAFLAAEKGFKPGDRYTLELRRDGQPITVELTPQVLPPESILDRYLTGLFTPFCFLTFAVIFFLIKPNDKVVLLLVIGALLASMAIPPTPPYLRTVSVLSVSLAVTNALVKIISLSVATVTFQFFLNFPQRLPLIRRFPVFEYLIYLPYVIFVFLPLILSIPYFASVLDIASRSRLGNVGLFFYNCLLAANLVLLVFSYLWANGPDRRRLNLIFVGFTIGYLPSILATLIESTLTSLNGWIELGVRVTPVVMPFFIGYAVLRHKVIPFSFVVRRGLQYLLAKNALRLLLVLPLLGVVWNIAASPNRTLSEILLQNSASFYLFIILAIALVLINRYGLREWIDRRFFREQYQQEKVLRDLTETVSDSDSLTTLSRLVSSKIQAALHPENVYLFFRDDEHRSDFSLSYSTSGHSTSANLRLAADSPLLRFMQRQRDAIDFPFRDDGDLPPRESVWLRSIDASLLVPMHGTDRKLAGFFSLGEKKSEIPYTGRDKELLETLAQQIALVHENLNLKDRMRHEQRIKTEVLSRFDEGNINLLKECPKCGRCYDRSDERCADDSAELTFSLPVERMVENRYRLERLLGKGGMGAVYEATDTRINRSVAVKILSGAMFGNRDALRRFEREAQTAGRLHHHNIVTVFDYGVLSTEGAFLVMELVNGESLGEVFNRESQLDPTVISNWFSQVLDGVEAAHTAGIIHRDLKPENIFVSSNESGQTRLCILDFGLARLSETEIAAAGNVTVPGTVIGTFGYMPPEQLRGEKVDERTDLFAVAVMIYEALHGNKPFAGKSYHELLTSMAAGIEIDPDKRLATFFERGLAHKPEDRFASASEMKESLLHAVRALPH